MGGQLPLIPAAMKLAVKSSRALVRRSAGRRSRLRITRRRQLQENVSLQAAGGAVQKFREKLADEQELIGALSNVVMEIYAMESCLLPRAKSLPRRRANSASQTMIDAARVLINDAAERVEHEAKRAIAAIHEGDMLTTQMAVLNVSRSAPPVDTIALRRRGRRRGTVQDRYPRRPLGSSRAEVRTERDHSSNVPSYRPYQAGHAFRGLLQRPVEFPIEWTRAKNSV